eukprot:1954549-Rhodomonas_salina.1
MEGVPLPSLQCLTWTIVHDTQAPQGSLFQPLKTSVGTPGGEQPSPTLDSGHSLTSRHAKEEAGLRPSQAATRAAKPLPVTRPRQLPVVPARVNRKQATLDDCASLTTVQPYQLFRPSRHRPGSDLQDDGDNRAGVYTLPGGRYFTLRKILQRSGDGKWVQVSWQNFGPSRNSWVEQWNLQQDCPRALKQFEYACEIGQQLHV